MTRIPYASWQRYGDTSVIADNYEAMKKWVLFLEAHSNGSYVLGDDMGPAGDWMNAGEGTPGWYTATTYFGWDAQSLAQMANALGKDEDAARFEQIHDSISTALVERGTIKADGTFDPNTQAGYIMALYAKLVPDAQVDAAAAKLVANIEGRGIHLSTGFASTGWALPVLTQIGRTDLAYELVQQEEYPSWGYMVDSGATTIWERWDFIVPGSGAFNPNLNGSSPDHAVFGSVGNWMYENIGGIVGDPTHPGYREFSVAPQPGGTITAGTGSFDSRYGTITSDWNAQGSRGGFELQTTVPAGSSATVSIPLADGQEVREGNMLAAKADGVTFVNNENGRATYRVGSGSYSFVTRAHPQHPSASPSPKPPTPLNAHP